jgi:FAD/FMN-containing dehydrogenase
LRNSDLTDFADLEGRVGDITPQGAPDFREAVRQRIWNQRLATERHPAAIATIRDANEAVSAINFARQHGLQVTVRGHGHNYAAAAARDGTLMLDVGRLEDLEVDLEARTAWAGAAVSGGQLLDVIEPLGLAFPIGHCSNVPLSGYVLSGGFGWNAGEWGPASANVLAIDLVTAAGDYLRVDAEDHPDLFWAARGSGSGFFAAALRYQLKLHPLPATAYTWSATFTTDSARVLAGWLSEATAAADRTAEIICLVGPDHHSGKPAIIVRASATAASEAVARGKVREFHSPPPEATLIEGPTAETMDFSELTKLSAMPNDKRVQADQLWSNGSLGEMLRAVHHLAGIPDKTSSINLISPGGGTAIPHCDGTQGALSIGGAAGAGIYAMWDDAAHDKRHFDWVRQADAALSRFRVGRYVGEADLGAAPDRVRECFAPEALARIERLRAQWDPANMFGGFPTA